MTSPLLLVVAVALKDQAGRYLLAQRPEGKALQGLWEFPGGKVDPEEIPERALCRELQEELGITVDPEDLKPLTFVSYAYEEFHLLMPLYFCEKWLGLPHSLEGQNLAWVSTQDFLHYPMPPADVPLAAFLRTGSKA